MVFQDFDQISERRRLERARKFRQRVIITVVLATVIILLIGAAVFIQVSPAPSSSSKTSNKDGKSKKHPKSNADTDTESKDASSAEKMIVMICNSTDYKEKCESILKDGLKANPKSSDPKELIKLAITAAAAEVKSALKKATNLKFATPEEKGAFEDCKVLMEDAVEELEMSMTAVSKKNQGKLTEKATPDLNNWLSAVMSYHETCVDGFPDGSKMKHEMEKIGKSGKELTSNSLAMISQVATFFSKFESEGPGEGAATRRRLMDQDELPSWMDSNERRMLKSATAGDKPTPNVVVAQDGSGNFKTINEALAAMPAKYDGRYVINQLLNPNLFIPSSFSKLAKSSTIL